MFKWFRRLLITGWAFLALFVVASFTLPKPMSRLFGWSAHFFTLVPIALLFATALYVVIAIFRAGMRRAND